MHVMWQTSLVIEKTNYRYLVIFAQITLNVEIGHYLSYFDHSESKTKNR
jgi:hypothetical protein